MINSHTPAIRMLALSIRCNFVTKVSSPLRVNSHRCCAAPTKENGAAIPLSSEGSGFMALIVLTLLNNAARVTQNMN